MEDLIFIEIAIEHLEKMRKRIVTESKAVGFKTIIGNDFVLKAKTSNEISVCSNTVKAFTGLTRSELIKEVNKRHKKEMEEIDKYVELKKILDSEIPKGIQENFKKEHEKIVSNLPKSDWKKGLIGNSNKASEILREMFKDFPGVTILSKEDFIGKNTKQKESNSWCKEQEQIHDKQFINAYPLAKVDDFGKEILEQNFLGHLELTKHKQLSELKRKPIVIDKLVLEERIQKLKKEEQRLKKLPKNLRGDLKEVQQSINTVKSWLLDL